MNLYQGYGTDSIKTGKPQSPRKVLSASSLSLDYNRMITTPRTTRSSPRRLMESRDQYVRSPRRFLNLASFPNSQNAHIQVLHVSKDKGMRKSNGDATSIGSKSKSVQIPPIQFMYSRYDQLSSNGNSIRVENEKESPSMRTFGFRRSNQVKAKKPAFVHVDKVSSENRFRANNQANAFQFMPALVQQRSNVLAAY